MKNPIFFFLFFIIIATTATGCEDDDDNDCTGIEAIVGLGAEGCTTLEPVGNSDLGTLEPVNVDDFTSELPLGQTVCVTYENFNGASTCQAGRLVTLNSLSIVD